jgi:hypothetical protein
MPLRALVFLLSVLVAYLSTSLVSAQGVQPYPDAITNRLIYSETPLQPPPVSAAFRDPDLGSLMVRVTDENSDPKGKEDYFYNPPQDDNEWSVDDGKFYVAVGYDNASLAFAFDPATMAISSLPGAGIGGGLLIPLRPGPTFSFVDPDLMFGTALREPLVISTYRFSTGVATPLFDTSACGTQPPLIAGPDVYSSDSTVSDDDSRIDISAGGRGAGTRPFVIVYDQTLGCRWYNTQTGQIGGQWGPTGQTSTPDRFLFNHSKISGNGQYIRISRGKEFYVWDTTSLDVEPCYQGDGPPYCDGYGAVGFDTYVNEPGVLDELNTFRRPLGDLTDFTKLINPLPLPHLWGMETNFAWSNGRLNSSLPVCGTLYSPAGITEIEQPYDGEVVCIETDGVASTIWRFAHNRAVWDPEYFWTQPLGNISLDGRFFSFTSSWGEQLGNTGQGDPRTDVWIVHLD